MFAACRLFTPALLLVSGVSAPTAQIPQAPAPPPAPSALPAPEALLSQGLAALKANQPRQALADFQQVVTSGANGSTANLLAATAALELFQGPLAVRYAEAARRLDPQNWKIDTTLVAAYAAAGMKPQRDQERALLRQLHASGPREARQANGFLLEMFPLGPAFSSAPIFPSKPGQSARADAIEYFQPIGRSHTCYRFVIREPDGKRAAEIDVDNNDFDEKSWAEANPTLAAAGERHFQITGHTASGDIDYRTWTGKPNDYDTLRAIILHVLATHPLNSPAPR